MSRNLGLFLLIVAAGGLYAGSRWMTRAFLAGVQSQPGKRAIAQWLPICIVSLLATAMDRPAIALGVIFSTSVASLSLVTGSVAMLAPINAPASFRRSWIFLLPAALLTLLIGFKGRLEWYHAVMLLLEGAVIWRVWCEMPEEPAANEPPAVAPAPARRVGLIVVASIIILLSASAAVAGTIDMATRISLAPAGLIAAALVAPLLVLPMIGAGQHLVTAGRGWEAAGSNLGLVLLNLCLALPLTILEWHAIHFFRPLREGALPSLLAYPVGIWRVDAVVLVVLGLMMVPVSLGRWTLSRNEGIVLVAGYIVYVSMAVVASF